MEDKETTYVSNSIHGRLVIFKVISQFSYDAMAVGRFINQYISYGQYLSLTNTSIPEVKPFYTDISNG